jgi:hypothetical protein
MGTGAANVMPQFGHRVTPGGSGAPHCVQRNVVGCMVVISVRTVSASEPFILSFDTSHC